MTKTAHACALACLCLLFPVVPTTVVGQTYTVTTLEPSATNAGNFSRAQSINNDGVVIGEGSATYTPGIIHIWRPGQPPEPRYLYNYNQSRLAHINDSGQFVGNIYKPDGWHGYYNSMDLGLGTVNDVNNSGQVVGWNVDSVFLYKDGVFDFFPTAIECGGEAVAINDSGVAAGYWSTQCTPEYHSEVAMFRNDSVILLGTPTGVWAEATDINNRGQIVGWYSLCGNCADNRGFVWDEGTWTIIPTLGGIFSAANAINDQGVVVGESRYTSGTGAVARAIIYDPINGLRDLNTLIPGGTGWELWEASDINEHGEIAGTGFLNGVLRGFLLTPPPNRFIRLTDNAGFPIANMPVTVSEVMNSAPLYPELKLVEDTTDAEGMIGLPRRLGLPGKLFTIRTTVYREPALKGTTHRTNLYSIQLDNMRIDSVGAVSFDTTGADSVRTVILDHTTILINLIVSIEWDAGAAYAANLKEGIKLAANYLYDLTDGQARFDTVFVFSDRQNWEAADVQIFASNAQWPKSTRADRVSASGAYSADPGETVKLPRIFYVDKEVQNREADWLLYPYDWTIESSSYDPDGSGPDPMVTLSFCPSRTLVHELGHNFFGFYDEYEDQDGNEVWQIYNYGMMDDQLGVDIQSSELSCSWQYTSPDKRVTEHWQNSGVSCWEWLEQDFGEVHSGVWCEIASPDESNTPTRMVMGPNDDILHALDYDVSTRIVFPVSYYPSGAPTKTVLVTASEQTSLPVAGAEVVLRSSQGGGSSIRVIEQGMTNAGGQIRVVGFTGQVSDITSSNGFVRPTTGNSLAAQASTGFEWYFGEGDWGSTTDTVIIQTRSVSGYFPMILRLAHKSPHGATYLAQTEVQLPPGMQLSLYDDDGTPLDTTPQANGLVASVVWDSLGEAGDFVFSANDSAGYRFPIPSSFVKAVVQPGAPNRISPSQGDADLTLDSITASSGLSTVSLLSTPYPVIRSGLTNANAKVSRTHAIASWPPGPFSGVADLSIRYEDLELDTDTENSIRAFRWDTLSQSWNLVGGTVNAASDEVVSQIQDAGVYALFTQMTPTGATDESTGGALPKSFELIGNYPNPFNAATTIEFALPEAARVRIEVYNTLGRRVSMLLDESRAAGRHRIDWNGTDDEGRSVSTGVYLYRFSAGDVVKTKKMLLLK